MSVTSRRLRTRRHRRPTPARRKRAREDNRRAKAKMRAAGFVRVTIPITAASYERVRLHANRLGCFQHSVIRAALESGLSRLSVSDITRLQSEWTNIVGLPSAPVRAGVPSRYNKAELAALMRRIRGRRAA